MLKYLQLCVLVTSLTYNPMNAGCQAPIENKALNIGCLADALDMDFSHRHHAVQPGQIWSCLSVIIDRSAAKDFDSCPVEEYNLYSQTGSDISAWKAKTHYAFLSVVHYYIINSQKIAEKSCDEQARIVVLFPECTGEHAELCDEFVELADKCFADLAPKKITSEHNAHTHHYMKNNTVVHFQKGHNIQDESVGMHDIIICLNRTVGLNADWKEGSLIMPERYVPADLDALSVRQGDSYEVNNHLVGALSEVLLNAKTNLPQELQSAFQGIEELCMQDFHSATVLQPQNGFNAKWLPKELWVE